MSSYQLIRDARVEVKHHVSEKKNVAVITVSDNKGEKYEHRFPTSSRVSHHLDIMTAADLQERLNHGTYFFVEDMLVSFRDGNYNGFVHTDETIDRFMDLLGYQHRKELPLHRGSRRKRNNDSESDIMLRKVWSQQSITVPGFKGGADFNSQMSFVWDPFVRTINAAYDLVRLICTNGMIGTTSFLNTKVPLLNRWEEHLNIASRQVQNKVESVVRGRIGTMVHQAASVSDCLLLSKHTVERLNSKQADFTEDDRKRLLAFYHVVTPQNHLSELYQPVVFQNKNIAAQVPSHLSLFDAFNIATELRTHTEPTNKSTDFALDRFANALLFDVEGNYEAAGKRFTEIKVPTAFGDPERAFYGQLTN